MASSSSLHSDSTILFEASKASAAAARARVLKLQRELLETRVASASRSTLEAKLHGVKQYKAERDAPKQIAKTAEPASYDRVLELSKLCNRRLAELTLPPPPPSRTEYEDENSHSWVKLFKRMDEDGSGQITYCEFEAMARQLLRVSRADFDEASLRSIWAALDSQGSGFLKAGQFGGFMRRGERFVRADDTTWQERALALRKGIAD